MAGESQMNGAREISFERQMLKRSLTLLPLFGIIYFTVSGGTFGIESLFSTSGPGPPTPAELLSVTERAQPKATATARAAPPRTRDRRFT